MDSQTCVTCGKRAPDTETNYTLISAQFGWRLTRFKGPDGSLVLEWRCPTCWREYKRMRVTTGTPQGQGASPAATGARSTSSWPPAADAASSGAPPTVSGVPASGPPRTTRRSSR